MESLHVVGRIATDVENDLIELLANEPSIFRTELPLSRPQYFDDNIAANNLPNFIRTSDILGTGTLAKDTTTVSIDQRNSKSFYCTHCDYTTEKENEMENHSKLHSEKEAENDAKRTENEDKVSDQSDVENESRSPDEAKPFSCDQCNFRTKWKKALKLHVKMHTGIRHQCPHCSYSSATAQSLKHHVKKHADVKPYRCTQCDFGTIYKLNLKVHMKKHTGQRDFCCSKCDATFIRKHELKNHDLTAHLKIKPFQCGQCEYKTAFKSTLTKHELTHSFSKDSKIHKCTKCDFTTPHSHEFKKHYMQHDNIKLFHCTYCTYTTLKKPHLKVHLTTHSNERPYKCSFCVNSFARKDYLKRHEMKHTKTNLIHCPHCDYYSTDKSDFNKHIKTHPEEKQPLPCSLCSSTFKHKKHLRDHLKIHSLERSTYKCSKCEFTANGKRTLIIHEKEHLKVSQEKPGKSWRYYCRHCKETFGVIADFKKHLKSHSKDIECSHCSFTCVKISDFREHLRSHSTRTSIIDMNKYLKEFDSRDKIHSPSVVRIRKLKMPTLEAPITIIGSRLSSVKSTVRALKANNSTESKSGVASKSCAIQTINIKQEVVDCLENNPVQLNAKERTTSNHIVDVANSLITPENNFITIERVIESTRSTDANNLIFSPDKNISIKQEPVPVCLEAEPYMVNEEYITSDLYV